MQSGTGFALWVEEDEHDLDPVTVDGVRSVRSGEHPGGPRPGPTCRGANQQLAVHREHEVQGVVRVELAPKSRTTDDQKRRPGFHGRSRSNGGQPHAPDLPGWPVPVEGMLEPGRVSAAKTSDARAEALRGNEY